MLKLRNTCVTFNKLNLNDTALILKQQRQQFGLRYQSTATPAATVKNDDEAAATKEWQNAKPYQEIPTMNTFSMLMKFLPGGKYSKLDTTQLMEAFLRDMGRISRLPGALGRPDVVLTDNVEDFEKVLRNEGIWPHRPGNEGMTYHREVHRADFFKNTNGLLATQGEQWGNFRTVVNPVLMQPKIVKLYLNKMSQVNKEFIERIRQIRDPQTLEVPETFEEEMNRWTLESVSVVALDKQLGLITTNRDDPMAKKLFKTLTDVFVYSGMIDFSPAVWKIYKTPTFNKLMKAFDVATDIISSYVNEAIERIEEDRKNGVPEKPDSEKSVLEKLIKIDKKVASVMAMDLLMAGVDTTSSAFTGLLLSLAKNPEKQQKLREEVMKILPQKDSEFDEDSIKNMPYLRACIKESLRLYPLTVGNARIPIRDVVLSGYRVPKGTAVTMLTVSLFKDNNLFPKADEYLPERWLRPSKESENANECPHSMKPSNPFTYLPFGFGARSCIGRRIVEMEIELGIARMIRNFHIEFNYPTDNAFRSVLINVANIPMKFKFSDIDY